ncbi:MAG: flavodoxin family protein [Candidatus Humimicrobiaceae bacterium]
MKALVIFDSNFGNTKKIAEAISDELGEDSKLSPVSDIDIKEIREINLLIAGSPINAWRPSKKMNEFLDSLTVNQLAGIKAASFDTRIKTFMSGDAAKKISKSLKKAGAEILTNPQPFLVKGREGPLLDGEIEKAIKWAKSIKRLYKE